jgi:hypothetical protein
VERDRAAKEDAADEDRSFHGFLRTLEFPAEIFLANDIARRLMGL